MKTGKTFIQVFVESENDLPKDDHLYFCNDHRIGYYWNGHYWREFGTDRKIDVDWYLVEQPRSENKELQQLDGDYDIHVPFKAKDGKKYKLVPVEQSQQIELLSDTFQTSPTKLDQENNTK